MSTTGTGNPKPRPSDEAPELIEERRRLWMYWVIGSSDARAPYRIADRVNRPPLNAAPGSPAGIRAWIERTGSRLVGARCGGRIDLMLSRPYGDGLQDGSFDSFRMHNPAKAGNVRIEARDRIEDADEYARDLSEVADWSMEHGIGMHVYTGSPRCVPPSDPRSWIWAEPDYAPEHALPKDCATGVESIIGRLYREMIDASSSRRPVIIHDTGNRAQGESLHDCNPDVNDACFEVFRWLRQHATLGIEPQPSISSQDARWRLTPEEVEAFGPLYHVADAKSWEQARCHMDGSNPSRAKSKWTDDYCAANGGVAVHLVWNPPYPEDLAPPTDTNPDPVNEWRVAYSLDRLNAGHTVALPIDYILNAMEAGTIPPDSLEKLLDAAA